jgi:hypothetical protein
MIPAAADLAAGGRRRDPLAASLLSLAALQVLAQSRRQALASLRLDIAAATLF